MSRDREEELPGKVHGPRTSSSSLISTVYSVTDGRDVESENCSLKSKNDCSLQFQGPY